MENNWWFQKHQSLLPTIPYYIKHWEISSDVMLAEGVEPRLGSLPSRCPGITPSLIYNLLIVAGTIVGANIYTCGPQYLQIKLFLCWTVVSIE